MEPRRCRCSYIDLLPGHWRRRRNIDLVDAMDHAIAGRDIRAGDEGPVDAHLVARHLDRRRLTMHRPGGRPLAHIRSTLAALEQVVVEDRAEFNLVLRLEQFL